MRLMRGLLAASAVAVILVIGIAGGLYLANGAPAAAAVPASATERGSKPYVVKIHARWCYKCMLTKGVWSELEEAYAGRVHLVVLDYTDLETTEASEREARRLGLDALVESVAGTGSIVVLDAATREVTASITGSREFGEYAAAIDAALQRADARP